MAEVPQDALQGRIAHLASRQAHSGWRQTAQASKILMVCEIADLGILPNQDNVTIMLKQPQRASEAEKLIRSLTESGDVHFRNPYVAKRQAERKIENLDIINVLQRGKVREAEFENGEWRHQVWTARFTVVVSLEDDGTMLNVCTCWRNQS